MKYGWQCPICENVYSPSVDECLDCNNKTLKKIVGKRTRKIEKLFKKKNTITDFQGVRVSQSGGCGSGGCR